ncbi:hypothetical protein ACTL32_08620 [Planococcus sp. FY231025]|uniref:hypothetical protein n=1 Tax=Planococcus sp. FY231025 TaxID=3455699 RepID=UPI003F927D2E
MSKKEFIEELNEIIKDPIFIGNSIEDLFSETGENTWSVSMGQALVDEFTKEELVLFFTQVQTNRKEQIVQTSDHPIIFYAWFDWQAASLKFSLISDFHEKLPFGRPYKTIASIEPIVAEFLQFPFHEGLPITETHDEISNEMEEDEEVMEPLNVFSIVISN